MEMVKVDHEPVDIHPSQVTPMSVARIFLVSCHKYRDMPDFRSHLTLLQLHPSTVWLREECGSRTYFPDAMNATFDLPQNIDPGSVSLIVEGTVPGTHKRKLISTQCDNDFQNSVKLPLALLGQLQDTFKCNICCSYPIKPLLSSAGAASAS